MKHLVIKAHTNADFEGIDVVILELVNEVIEAIETLKRNTLEFASKKELQSLSFNETSFFFYGHAFKNIDSDTFKVPDSFAIVDNLNEDEFTDPETHLDCYEITLDRTGFQLKAWGKYTGDEFYSDHVDYTEFAEALKK